MNNIFTHKKPDVVGAFPMSEKLMVECLSRKEDNNHEKANVKMVDTWTENSRLFAKNKAARLDVTNKSL